MQGGRSARRLRQARITATRISSGRWWRWRSVDVGWVLNPSAAVKRPPSGGGGLENPTHIDAPFHHLDQFLDCEGFAHGGKGGDVAAAREAGVAAEDDDTIETR